MSAMTRKQKIEYLVYLKYPFYENHKKVLYAKAAATGVKSGGAGITRIKIPRRIISARTEERGSGTIKDAEAYKTAIEGKSDTELNILFNVAHEG